MNDINEARKPKGGSQRTELAFLKGLYSKVNQSAGAEAAKATIAAIGSDLVKAGQISSDMLELFCDAYDITDIGSQKKTPTAKKSTPTKSTTTTKSTSSEDPCFRGGFGRSC